MSKKQGNNKNKSKQYWLTALVVILVIVAVALVGLYFNKNKTKEDEKTLAYTDLIKEMSAGNIIINSASIIAVGKNEII